MLSGALWRWYISGGYRLRKVDQHPGLQYRTHYRNTSSNWQFKDGLHELGYRECTPKTHYAETFQGSHFRVALSGSTYRDIHHRFAIHQTVLPHVLMDCPCFRAYGSGKEKRSGKTSQGRFPTGSSSGWEQRMTRINHLGMGTIYTLSIPYPVGSTVSQSVSGSVSLRVSLGLSVTPLTLLYSERAFALQCRKIQSATRKNLWRT
jgi:hypothetical protein